MGAYVKLYEVVGSQLRAICISEFFDELKDAGPEDAAMSILPVVVEEDTAWWMVDPSKWTRPFFDGKVTEFYKEHSPSMIKNVPGLLDKHAGKHGRLWQALHKKYMSKDAAPSVAQQAMVDTAQETKDVAGLIWRVPPARVPVPTQAQLEEIMMTKGGR